MAIRFDVATKEELKIWMLPVFLGSRDMAAVCEKYGITPANLELRGMAAMC